MNLVDEDSKEEKAASMKVNECYVLGHILGHKIVGRKGIIMLRF